ncbi:MAG TPA: TraB/GumN family protein [Burkholderiales bacterium]|nr:TraB/GumN family protein [Burkholderiales bacterium]
MKFSQGLRGLVAAIGASLAALSIAFSPVATRDAAAQVDAPALWRIAGPKGNVFLFGSFHLLPADVKWRTPAVESALNEAAVVVFETDFAGAQDPRVSQALIAKYGFLPPGQTLRSVLSTSTNAELEKTATDLEIPPPSLAPLRPWLAALTLGLQFAIHQGFDPSNGVEQQVITSAKASGKSLRTLETNESQLRVFADLTREQEVELLTVTLRQVRETPKMLEDMLTAYRKGDLAALERTVNIGFDDFPALRKRILKDRHDKWLPQIENMIADGRTHLIIVGAAHLVGPDSVIVMLRAKGVKVEGP